MKIFLLLLAAVSFSLVLQSCGGTEDESGESNDSTNENDTEVSTQPSDDGTIPEKVEESNKADEEYHITLNAGGEEITTGPSKGKAMISDNWICTVGDWKMRILVDEFNPEGMVGNEYHAHIISKDFNSTNCICQMENVSGTGDINSIGEKVKMEGTIACDDGATNGSFAVKLIQPKK